MYLETISPEALTDKIEALCCYNKSSNEELRAYITKMMHSFARVASTPALCFADTLRKGLEMSANNKTTEPVELAKLAVWAGQIKVGWL